MALSKAKSGGAWQSHFWQCGTLWPARNTKLLHYASKSKWVLFKQQASTQLGRTTFWSPKSQCVYGPENEIAAVTFFCEKWRSFTKKQYFCKCNGMAGFRGTRLLIEGLQPRLHVASLCQSIMLFGIVWVLLSQAFATWRGWGADSAATLLAGCFFCVCVCTAQFCFGLLMRCLFLGSPPFAHLDS